MSTRADDPRLLLRQLLRKAEELGLVDHPDGSGAPPPTPVEPPRRPPEETSPIRPPAPEVDDITEHAAPMPPLIQPDVVEIPQQIVGVEERLQAETALETLRKKTALAAAEFAEGKLNRAQFIALYVHYHEKRQIIERLLERDPDTQAWQSVAESGNTGFLRAHFEARVLSYALYNQDPLHYGEIVSSQGQPLLPEEMVTKIQVAITMVMRNHREPKAQRKSLDDGRCAIFVPGEQTTTIVVFSLEPSARQIAAVQDLHRDFERANRRALQRGIRQPEQLVFPHRALFD
ncbi:MAG: hypothetical protein IT323_14215 [Anaerolineae bacterium]|nr:hypothetical protein [Anaerolineae bacterium]